VENNADGTAETNNSGTLTFTSVSAPYADLQVANISVDPADLTSGATFTVRWDDSNTGTKATGTGWTDVIVIKNLTTGETLATVNVPYDPAQAGNGEIAGGTSRARQYTGKLPDGVRGVGQIQITITTDSNNTVAEFNAAGTAETNNT
ncbi:CARDB domain-containing protein, partial [Xanthomonas citri pv. citri]